MSVCIGKTQYLVISVALCCFTMALSLPFRPLLCQGWYSVIILANPNFAPALVYRGNLREELGDFKGALDDFSLASKLVPDSPSLYLNKGLMLCNLDRNNEAIDAYTKAIALDSTMGVAFFNRAIAHDRLNHLDSAISDYKKARKYGHKIAASYFYKGMCEFAKGNKQVALSDYSMSIRLGIKADYVVYFSRGELKERMGDLTGALSDYEMTRKIEPSYRDLNSKIAKLKNLAK